MKKIVLLVLFGLSGCAQQAEDFLYDNHMFVSKSAESQFYSMQHATTASGMVDGHSVQVRSYPDIGYTHIYVSP
jgi:hypothetical protein